MLINWTNWQLADHSLIENAKKMFILTILNVSCTVNNVVKVILVHKELKQLKLLYYAARPVAGDVNL